MAEPICIVPAGDWTGEGATWHAAENALYWVDIGRFLVHRFDPASGSVKSWFFPEPPAALALTDRADTLLVALGGRVILWQPANDARAEFVHPEKNWPKTRMNDGRADPAGNFWVGSMRYEMPDDAAGRVAGRLFRVTPNGSVSVEKTGIGISNTLCWSPDAKLFYFGDTDRNAISVWDYDAAAGTIANERPFFTGCERGGPDGSAMDSAGYLWNARFGGGCVVRVAPNGKVDRVVEMPVPNVTTCAFGGADLKTLYITSARGGTGSALRLSGGLFSLAVDVPGTPENHFRLAK
jgi:sugar lactone lactonase YvrE